jgi:hypothetical protein
MTLNLNAAASSSQLKQFTLYSNNNRDVDITGGFIEMCFYQSCLDYSVRVTAIIGDTGYRLEDNSSGMFERDDLNLTAGEKATILAEDGYGNKLSFLDDYHLRLQQVRDIDEHTGKAVFTLDFYSKECIDNELVECRVTKRYNGRISDSVSSILSETLKTSKKLYIDETINKFNFLGNIEKPFYKIPWLASKSVPNLPESIGKYAGYFFYETPDDGHGNGGYHFKSIDKFFSQTPKKKLIFNNTPFLPSGYDEKILAYSINSSVNLDNTLRMGSLTKPILKSFNPFTQEYKEETTFSDVERMNENYMGGTNMPQIAQDLDLWNKSTKIYNRWKPIGILPTGSTLEKQLEEIEAADWDIESIERQAKARYNNLFNTRLNITIPGDFSIQAGDIITCDFPEISGKASKIVSNKKSGNYLVIDVAHRITKMNCFTSINLVRESIYKT